MAIDGRATQFQSVQTLIFKNPDYLIALVSAEKTSTKKANASAANALPPAPAAAAPKAPMVTLQQIIKRLDKN